MQLQSMSNPGKSYGLWAVAKRCLTDSIEMQIQCHDGGSGWDTGCCICANDLSVQRGLPLYYLGSTIMAAPFVMLCGRTFKADRMVSICPEELLKL